MDDGAERFLQRVKIALDHLDRAKVSDGQKLLALRAAQAEILKMAAALTGDDPGGLKFVEICM